MSLEAQPFLNPVEATIHESCLDVFFKSNKTYSLHLSSGWFWKLLKKNQPPNTPTWLCCYLRLRTPPFPRRTNTTPKRVHPSQITMQVGLVYEGTAMFNSLEPLGSNDRRRILGQNFLGDGRFEAEGLKKKTDG